MTSFYTNVQVYGSRILYRGVEDGRKVKRKIDYFPTLYVPSKVHTGFTSVSGDAMAEMKPGNIRETRDFVEQYKDVENFKIYGNQKYEYAFISDHFSDDVDWDLKHINVTNIDIEVGSENGFPEPEYANEPITAITMKNNQGKFIVLGCGKFDNKRDDVWYIQCRDEIDLIKRFIDEWSSDYPDIVTGWNVERFDIVYLANRIRKILGEEAVKRLSPWMIVNERKIRNQLGIEEQAYDMMGIAVLDYLAMYKKFAPEGKSQESYKLDAIAHNEVGERKLSYEEYGNLHTLYKDNYQLFIEYNIKDVELVERIDDKLKLIELALTLAYDSKTNYMDAFSQVRMWDAIVFNHLKKKNIVVDPIVKHSKDAAYEGAFVKDPILGMHKWVASFDLNSLYPHLIMQYNISPDTIIEDYKDGHRQILTSRVSVDNLLHMDVNLDGLVNLNCTLTPNGQFFTKERHGFLPEIMETMYNDRSAYKKKAIAAKKELEKETDPTKRYEIEKRIARYNNLQLAKKVSLNSAYGALGNQYFRYFDVRQASGITTAGQLSIRWIEKKINDYLNKILKTEDADYVIASDTDSIYLSLDRLVSKTIIEQKPNASTKQIIAFMDKVCEDKIQPFIDKAYAELAGYVNAYEQKMIMKREALADKGIWTAKKRYVLNVYNNEGVEYAKPKIKVMGLEMIKSSTPSFCREKLWEAIDVVLSGTEEDIIQFIEKTKDEFKNAPIAEISFPRGVNGLEKFRNKTGTGIFEKGCPIHVRGSLIYNSLLMSRKLSKRYQSIKEGEKIKFIYLSEPNTIQSNVISFPQILPEEFDIRKYIDYNTQYEKSFVEPLKIILDAIGWKTEHVSSLEDFFG